jgi:hypothetical protein
MRLQCGNWITDKKNKASYWIMAIALDGTLLMGWCIKKHKPEWCSCSTLTDGPILLEENIV